MEKATKEIYYSEKCNISYDSNTVSINNEAINDRDKSILVKDYAYKIMRGKYTSLLSKQYEDIVVLSGSGTSKGIGIGEKTGKTMNELWQAVVKEIHANKLKEFSGKIRFESFNEKRTDLESFLSKAILAQKFLKDEEIEKTIQAIEEIIQKECNLDLPDSSPHLMFLRKLTARKLKYSRVKIFTLNYDLLFEKAASKGGYVVIDGFSFNSPRVFNGINFDYDIVTRNINRPQYEENFLPKVFHLYKLHGSLDWSKRSSSNEEEIIKSYNPAKPLMIYPSNNKYEHSYEQPYFEMISRFQQALRNKNTLLLIIGFSFYDKHISAMIYEALNVNQSITVVVIDPSIICEESFVKLKEKTSNVGNICLINEKFDDFVKNYPSSDIYDYFDKRDEMNDTVQS